MTVASSSCLKRSVGTSQMRCLAKILSLIPTTAVQSVLKSALVPSLHSVRQGSQSVAESALAAQLVPGLGLPAFGSSCGGVRRSAPAVSMERLCWSPGWEGQSAQVSMWLLCHQQVLGSSPTLQLLRAGLGRGFAFLSSSNSMFWA